MSNTSLKPNETVLLSTLTSSPRLTFGCGWDVPSKQGFFNKLLSKKPETVDLDFSCIAYNDEDEIKDTVWYTELQSNCGGIKHSGDETTGETEGDDEQISIDLAALDPKVKSLIFTISSFSGATFEDVEDCFVRVIDASSNKEIAMMTFRGREDVTSKIMCKLTRQDDGDWLLRTINKGVNGGNIHDIYPHIRALLWS